MKGFTGSCTAARKISRQHHSMHWDVVSYLWALIASKQSNFSNDSHQNKTHQSGTMYMSKLEAECGHFSTHHESSLMALCAVKSPENNVITWVGHSRFYFLQQYITSSKCIFHRSHAQSRLSSGLCTQLYVILSQIMDERESNYREYSRKLQ